MLLSIFGASSNFCASLAACRNSLADHKLNQQAQHGSAWLSFMPPLPTVFDGFNAEIAGVRHFEIQGPIEKPTSVLGIFFLIRSLRVRFFHFFLSLLFFGLCLCLCHCFFFQREVLLLCSAESAELDICLRLCRGF